MNIRWSNLTLVAIGGGLAGYFLGVWGGGFEWLRIVSFRNTLSRMVLQGLIPHLTTSRVLRLLDARSDHWWIGLPNFEVNHERQRMA